MKFNEIRDKHARLIYEGLGVLQEDGNLKVTFDFLLTPDIKFRPTVIFPNVSKERLEEIGTKVLENLAFNLGMVELISYWKAACPAEIVVGAGFLDESQIAFWEKLLIKGLGEFFYTNKIDFTSKDLVVIKTASHSSSGNVFHKELKDRDLVLVGGGKDSAVTLEMISNSKRESKQACDPSDLKSLILNPTNAALRIIKAAGSNDPVIIKRTIDPKLLELNSKGYLNGHTPFSAYLAFLSTFAGILYDYKNIVVSNESSSNEGNVFWKGEEINHQYSKSFEFEQDFRDYSKKYLSASSNYFSYLRNFGELQISEKFSKMKKYHKLFRSCNKGSKQGIWCGKCPKCVSTYLLLYPFLGKKTKEIFGKNLLEDESLIPLVGGLLRENDQVKPFECVATVKEIRDVISLGIERAEKDNEKIPKVLQAFQGRKTLILGFGREGKATLSYFKKHYPKQEIDIVDQKDGENYLDSISDYNVIIKSPGIPYLPEIKEAQKKGKTITSSTKIFFDKFKGKIIGVTGTKGKSTTTSLIYEVLKAGGINVHIIGNIGKPALDLLDRLDEDDVAVFELSSFQLEDLDKSPHIAVITNIYPEHLDHHGDFSNYLKSKNNIAAFQSGKDYLIFNEDNPEVRFIAQNSKANKIPFSKKDLKIVETLVHKDTVPLLGEFNLLNIIPAIVIGRLFKIRDEKIEETIINFKPLPHRLEFVGEFMGVRFYNDSLSTIPQTTISALETLGSNVETLIAGGYDRGLDFTVLSEAIAKSNVKNLILFPDTGEKIWEATKKCVKGQGLSIKYIETDNMEEAVKKAYEVTVPGKIVLLSPASSSFNLFKDYADRGSQFREWVRKLGGN